MPLTEHIPRTFNNRCKNNQCHISLSLFSYKMQIERALALYSCATAEVNIVRFVTWVCLVICMIPPFIPFHRRLTFTKLTLGL